MRRIGLLSDTHGYLDPRIFEYLASCDEIWHAGDFGNASVSDKLSAFKPLRGVYGNIDGQEVRKIHPKDLKFTCEGIKVWMTHIGGYPGNYPFVIRQEIARIRPDLFICGHSHILKVMHDKQYPPLLHINPGAAGLEGFHKVRTLVRFSIDNKKIKDMEVVELGLRGEPVSESK